jgi:long-chain acyl-CoA synthetase
MTIYEELHKSVQIYSDKIALQKPGEGQTAALTYKELDNRILRLASFLMEREINKGEKIMFFSKNRPEWIVAALAAFRIGVCVVPVDSQLNKNEVKNLMSHSSVRMVFTSFENTSLALSAAEEMEQAPGVIDFDSAEFTDACSFTQSSSFPELAETDLATLVYTSGTTGDPKGVMLSHKNLCYDAQALIKAHLISHNSTILSILPLHHTYPFMATFIAPLLAGTTVVMLDSLRSADILSAIRDFQVTILVGVPRLFELLYRGIMNTLEKNISPVIIKKLIHFTATMREKSRINVGKFVFKKVHEQFGPHFTYMASGGAKFDPDVARGLRALGFTVLEGYGLTETSPVVAFTPLKKQKTGSVGLPLPGVEIHINEPDSGGTGEIFIKGPVVMAGYYKNPEATESVINDGWFTSGDLGYFDDEGFLFITGRKKEVLVLASGKNIYPEEIEKHYLASPFIKEICVVLNESSSGGGENLEAVVVPDLDHFRKMKISTINDTIQWELREFSKDIPSYKRVKGFHVSTEPLPRTSIGKIRRFMVKDLIKKPQESAGKELSEKDKNLLNSKVGKGVGEYLKSLTKREAVNLDDNLELDLGLDSLQQVEMLAAFEDTFSIKFPEDINQKSLTMRDIINYIISVKGDVESKPSVKKDWSIILHDDPTEEELASLELSPHLLMRLSHTSVASFNHFLFKSLLSLTVEGCDNIPVEGPFIITPNHVSYLDAFAVGAAIFTNKPLSKKVFFHGLDIYFKGNLGKTLARFLQVIPISAESDLQMIMKVSSYLLRHGKALCIFPEGGRSYDGQMMEFKKGVGILAKELHIPLIPTLLKGMYHVLPRGQWKVKPHTVKVIFGTPVHPEYLDYSRKPDTMDDYEWLADTIKKKISEIQVSAAD